MFYCCFTNFHICEIIHFWILWFENYNLNLKHLQVAPAAFRLCRKMWGNRQKTLLQLEHFLLLASLLSNEQFVCSVQIWSPGRNRKWVGVTEHPLPPPPPPPPLPPPPPPLPFSWCSCRRSDEFDSVWWNLWSQRSQRQKPQTWWGCSYGRPLEEGWKGEFYRVLALCVEFYFNVSDFFVPLRSGKTKIQKSFKVTILSLRLKFDLQVSF